MVGVLVSDTACLLLRIGDLCILTIFDSL
uniref:Uncharacterized protein n=1 Tax=Anguilla anguilla TaxID=7936 RepID=A0A0E9TWC7_ANGAN